MKTLCAFICVMGILTAIPTFAADPKPPVIKPFEVDEYNNKIKPFATVDTKGQIIADKIDYLRLECHADYLVQWVYFSNRTDFPLASKLEGRRNDLDSHDYIASILLGPLKEHHTGKYKCSGVETKSVVPNVYIYVPGKDLFTSPQGETIEISRSVTSKLVPCAVTHPDVEVTLYKSEGSDFTPLAKSSDAKIFNPRRGFLINLKNVNNPEVRYVCSGRYRGLHQDVEYTLAFEETQSDQPAKYQEAEKPEVKKCQTHTDCPPGMRCQVGNMCYDPCIGRCGSGSKCKTVGVDNIPHCYDDSTIF